MYNSHDAFRSEPAVRAQPALRAARVKGERPEEKEDVVPAKLVPLRWGKPSTLLGIRNLYVSITHTHTHPTYHGAFYGVLVDAHHQSLYCHHQRLVTPAVSTMVSWVCVCV